jgi:hypothetical protein
MFFLMGEIAAGLVIMAVAGFVLGWVTRGIRERIQKRQVKS